MFVKIHTPHALPGGDNKGSCIRLVDYLEKENKGEVEKEFFFNHQDDAILKDDVISKIDNNNKNLGKNDNKFFMLTVNPSQAELRHLVQKTIGKEVYDFEELSKGEKGKLMLELKSYTRDVMDLYARNFGRDDINSGANLRYFAKIETSRAYKHFDTLVAENKVMDSNIFKLKSKIEDYNKQARAGKTEAFETIKGIEKNIRFLETQYHRQGEDIIRTGLKKEGLQLHAHIVVSRNDVTQKTKLSPLSKSKGGVQKLNGKDVKQGFCHEKFKQDSSALFASKYQYSGTEKERYVPKSQYSAALAIPGSNIVKAKIKSELFGDFVQEAKVFNQVKNIGKAVLNPTTIPTKIASTATRKLLEIIKGAASSSGI